MIRCDFSKQKKMRNLGHKPNEKKKGKKAAPQRPALPVHHTRSKNPTPEFTINDHSTAGYLEIHLNNGIESDARREVGHQNTIRCL
jgi:hypothetical protein